MWYIFVISFPGVVWTWCGRCTKESPRCRRHFTITIWWQQQEMILSTTAFRGFVLLAGVQSWILLFWWNLSPNLCSLSASSCLQQFGFGFRIRPFWVYVVGQKICVWVLKQKADTLNTKWASSLNVLVAYNSILYQTFLLNFIDFCLFKGYSITRKPSSRWQTRATLAKSLHGLRKSSGVVSCIVRLPIDSLPMVSYYVLYSNCL